MGDLSPTLTACLCKIQFHFTNEQMTENAEVCRGRMWVESLLLQQRTKQFTEGVTGDNHTGAYLVNDKSPLVFSSKSHPYCTVSQLTSKTQFQISADAGRIVSLMFPG